MLIVMEERRRMYRSAVYIQQLKRKGFYRRKHRGREGIHLCIFMAMMMFLGGMGGIMSYAWSGNGEAVFNETHTGNSMGEPIPMVFAIPDFDPIPPINIRVTTQPFHEKNQHYGVDLVATTEDAPIMAVEKGKVEKAGWGKETGNHLKIRHSNGYLTNYFHCKELRVKEGQFVKRGDIIAIVGTTGKSTGPHLHFELRINGKPVNPTEYVDLSSVE
ncbi:MAG: M23 family metallopeptidase [Anaerovorax sp.]